MIYFKFLKAVLRYVIACSLHLKKKKKNFPGTDKRASINNLLNRKSVFLFHAVTIKPG